MAAPNKTDAFVNLINPRRRSVMKTVATIARDSTVVLIGLLVHARAWAAGSDAPEKTELKVGFIPLTDCASMVMTSTLGLDRKHGIKIAPPKEAPWVGVRDKPVSGDLDTAYVLYGLIYGMQLGIGGPKKDMAVLMTLNNNGQTITLLPKLKETDVKGRASLKAAMVKDKREYMFVQTFPAGTHAMQLYYWLAAHGVHPLQDAKAIAVPPLQTVVNMRVDNMDGYYMGEPWGTRVTANDIGFTIETIQAIWRDHPEKVLGTTAEFVQKYPNTTRTFATAMLEASKFIDVSTSNRRKTAEIITAKPYVNTDMDAILDHIPGRYMNDLGKTWDDLDPICFYHDGAVNFPYLSDGMWFFTQRKHWSLLKTHPSHPIMAKQANRVDTFKQAVITTSTPLSRSDMCTTKSIDGVMRDAKNPAAYTDDSKLRA